VEEIQYAKGGQKMIDMYSLLRQMKEKGASDLHIVAGSTPVFRVDGYLKAEEGEKLTSEQSRLLIYSLMDREQQRRFEEGYELDFSLGVPGAGRFRIDAHFQRGSIAGAVRRIPYSVPSISELHLPLILEELALKEKGLILVTGPTGCGKSTTLAAMVEIINNKKAVHIITVEDPIEYVHSHKKSIVEQKEVGTDTLSFANSLKYSLRQDPDVILVGEMRDLETIATALTAAETGHLVLATLHTPDAPQAIDRIVDVFPPHQQPQIRLQLSISLEAVITQKLLPQKIGKGRVPAVEILIATPAVRNLIRSGKTHQLYTAMETGAHFGMKTMDYALRDLVKEDYIDLSLALKIARDPKNLQNFFKGSS